MRDLDVFCWPPRRSDFLLVVGTALLIYAAIERAWGTVIAALIVLLLGVVLPRMRGPFSLGGPKWRFQGELVDPDERKDRREGS